MSKKSWIPAYAGMTGKEVTGNAQNNMEFRGVRIGDLFITNDCEWEGI
jgi:hypothetical protein